jgi:hypothetical protein
MCPRFSARGELFAALLIFSTACLAVPFGLGKTRALAPEGRTFTAKNTYETYSKIDLLTSS